MPRLIAETVDGMLKMAELLEIPRDVLKDDSLTNLELKRRLNDYGLAVSMRLLVKYRGFR